jgi:hypothetical protein
MMEWFGKDWGAPVCRTSRHRETPVGRLCVRCRRGVKVGDRGFWIPADYVWHLDCFITSIGVHDEKKK